MINELIRNVGWNKRLELLRRIRGWTQKEAAEQCNTNQKMYWNWEKGINYPRGRTRVYIARAFKMKVEDIFPK